MTVGFVSIILTLHLLEGLGTSPGGEFGSVVLTSPTTRVHLGRQDCVLSCNDRVSCLLDLITSRFREWELALADHSSTAYISPLVWHCP